MRRIGSILVIVLMMLGVYAAAIIYFDHEEATAFITAATALFGMVAIWHQFKREKDLTEAQFIMDYNNSFLQNEELTSLEHRLELCRKGAPFEITEGDRQSLVNYLVYHEALAALVSRRVLHLEYIDDLLSYRFFLVVNNPAVQEAELCHPDEWMYYRGCFSLYEKWYLYRIKKGLPILFEGTSLHKTECFKVATKRSGLSKIKQSIEWKIAAGKPSSKMP